MKVVILAGGMGSRISEESRYKPKPMIEIGDKPILWHIMKYYSAFGFQEFIICCGYRGHMIKDYFVHYYMYQTDSTFDLSESSTEVRSSKAEPWKVTLVNTGLKTLTAGRLQWIQEYLGEDETFLLTYGDGLSDVNLTELLAFHQKQGRIATITTTQPPGRFGALKIGEGGLVESFREKARKDQSWVNAGFMVLDRKVFEYLGDGRRMLEDGPFEELVKMESWRRTDMKDSGRLWIRCGIRSFWKVYGEMEKRPGGCGERRQAVFADFGDTFCNRTFPVGSLY